MLMNPFFLLSVAFIGLMFKYGADAPIKFRDYVLGNQEKVALFGATAILINYLAGTFHTLLTGGLIGLSMVALHVFLHNPFVHVGNATDDKDGDISKGASKGLQQVDEV